MTEKRPEATQERRPHLLVVEDEPQMRQVLADMLGQPGWRVSTAADGQQALERIAADRPDAVLTDLNMPNMDGMELLRRVHASMPGLPVVVLTAYGSVPGAVDAMRQGAFDFLSKPPAGPEALREVMRRALAAAGGPAVDRAGDADRVRPIFVDTAAVELLALCRAVAARPTTVLITGESGVGKEVVARYIHDHSDRADGPFVALNCAALPESLQESELFGHERGAFTGAERAHSGRFEQAHGGTLLLDEVGEMAPALQAKLLRVLETRRVTRLGGDTPRPVDVRVLAATNRDLERAVGEGRFREDLLFRLNVFPLQIPPLRERPADVLPLARHFLALLTPAQGRRTPDLTPEAAEALQRHRWPGNVRELHNTLERAVILAGSGDILPVHLGAQPRAPAPAPPAEDAPADKAPPAMNLEQLELRTIREALEATGGNRRQAAKLLGIARRTLQYKLKKYDIE